ncbi:hypothetical protein PUNSTDRAFT_90645 [Punctularia strigosozonata HHB-11173 SS5]|uniref:uncharacterized protein n=1 Tax=Punctularia strigosozonata (strain HHB-11173) TaxID=741275 RepID=UPI00044180D5|nr:uncharacterized protein PUNSTDRAFT_90645 [Punctularia strigosozonata HHB-11173 SS5]EIN06926.1 hypothetical protein PUNSTDRAFT_90645 [Punctularia strigosozonata HHB-11173 SS5]
MASQVRDVSPPPTFPVPQPAPAFASNPTMPPQAPPKAPAFGSGAKANPITIPSNKPSFTPPPQRPPLADADEERFEETDDVRNTFEVRKTAGDAEKDLRDLLQSHVNDEQGEEEEEEEEEDAYVEGMNVVLQPHQRKSRKWMREREQGKKYGGILADDMGLGKTVQTLVRIHEGRAKKSDKKDGWSPTTLIVCPVALVTQWVAEVKKYAPELLVKEHHGPSRTKDPRELTSHHVVVTTYQVLASEYASHGTGAKDESAKSGKAKKQSVSSDDSSSADSDDSSAFGRSLAKKKAKPKAKAVKAALFDVKWFRVVLDEGHTIKNRNTKAAQACCALEAKFRWVLTGTPMQNNVEELYSLFKFLGIRPLNDWDHFNTHINKPVKSGKSARAMKRLQIVLRAIMLRRLKTDLINGKPLVELPPRTVEIVSCLFDNDERLFYESIQSKVEAQMNKLQNAGVIMKNYTTVLILLLRLRQACNHPALVSKDFKVDSAALESRPAKNQNLEEEQEDELAGMFSKLGVEEAKIRKCTICFETLDDDNSASKESQNCLDCEAQIERQARRRSVTNPDLPASSTKIRRILDLLQEIQNRGDGDEKTIVFSQFTSMLDLLQPFLKDAGIRHVRYDGSMSKPERDLALTKIRTSDSVKVILISFKAGSTGLNLTSCNNVILVDLWWNPALEDQAFDRAHRMGQTRPVNIYKLCVPETVEDRILALQEQKRVLAAAALSGDKVKLLNKLGMDELLALFKHGDTGHDGDSDSDSE